MGAVLVGVLVVAVVAGWLWQRAERSRLQAHVRDLQRHPEMARSGVAHYDGTARLRSRHDVPLTTFEARFRSRALR